jgi:hypothetical protein
MGCVCPSSGRAAAAQAQARSRPHTPQVRNPYSGWRGRLTHLCLAEVSGVASLIRVALLGHAEPPTLDARPLLLDGEAVQHRIQHAQGREAFSNIVTFAHRACDTPLESQPPLKSKHREGRGHRVLPPPSFDTTPHVSTTRRGRRWRVLHRRAFSAWGIELGPPCHTRTFNRQVWWCRGSPAHPGGTHRTSGEGGRRSCCR